MNLSVKIVHMWSLVFSYSLHCAYSAITQTRIHELLITPMQHIQYVKVMLRAQFWHDDSKNVYINWFFYHSPCPMTVGTYDGTPPAPSQEPQIRESHDSFVIITNTSQMRAAVKRFVNRVGKFFFILANETDFETDMADIMRHIWTEYIAYKMYWLTQKGVFVYDPFEFDASRQLYGKVVEYRKDLDLERFLFTDLRGYPLRVQIFRSVYSKPVLDPITRKITHVDGVDWEVAKLLQERLNFSMQLQEPNPQYFGERSANGSYNGVIGGIIKNEMDICLTGFFVKDYMVPEMDFTVAVYDDQLCIYVPKAKRVPQSILPIFSVRYDLWLGFLCTPYVCIIIWWIMRRLNLWLGINYISKDIKLDKTPIQQFIRISIDTWVVWVRVNILQYPPFYSERIFIASLCLVSVIFGAIFESSLATVFIHPLYYKDINSLRELDESGLKVIYKYSSMGDDLFFSETSPLFASLNKKLSHLKDLNADVIADVANVGGKAGVTRYTTLLLESLHFIISKRIYIVPDCPKYYTISYVMPRAAPWEETINNVLLRSLNAGLIKKYINDKQTQVDITIRMENQISSGDTFKVLTIDDLQLAFYVVLIGNLFASVSFLWSNKHCLTKST